MKKILTNFWDKTNLWIVWLVGFSFCMIAWNGFGQLLGVNKEFFWVMFKAGFVISLLMGLFITLIISRGRASDKVWEEIKLFKEKVLNTQDIDEFTKLYEELYALNDKAFHQYHWSEIKSLKAVMDIKIQYLK